jgi:DNA end-binding protein Ku
MAAALVEQMTEKWDPKRYTDDYTSALMKVIDRKVKSGGKDLPTEPKKPRETSNVIDLAAVLEESLSKTARKKAPAKKAGRQPRKKAA